MALIAHKVYDHLNLQNIPQMKQLLNQYGETVKYSVELIKINRKEKKQIRILLMTNGAIYNIKPNMYDKPQRRINLSDIASITISQTSLEFTINIPMEYDYRYIANDLQQRQEFLNIISNIYESIKKHPLNIHKITQPSTLAYTVNKKVANLTV